MENSAGADNNFRNRVLIFRVSILLTVLFFIILIVVAIIYNSSRSGGDGGDVTPQSEVKEESKIVFSDANKLAKMMGTSVFNILMDNVETVVMMQDEVKLVGDSDTALKATIVSKSLIEDIYFPYTTFSMFFEISDGRHYLVNVAMNKGQYCGILIQRTLVGGTISYGQPYLYITIIDNNQSQDLIVDGLMKWAKSIYPDGYVMTTTKV